MLREAIGRWCVVSPEFPTGNGKVDIHLRCRGKEGLIEVKSYSDQLAFQNSLTQAARYATSSGLNKVLVAVFVPTHDANVLTTLSTPHQLEGVHSFVQPDGFPRTRE